jgi:hypothetical protein
MVTGVTIERRWVRVLLSTPGRAAATVLTLFVAIVVAPVVLIVLGLAVVGLVVLVVGLGALAALAFALLPGRHHRR